MLSISRSTQPPNHEHAVHGHWSSDDIWDRDVAVHGLGRLAGRGSRRWLEPYTRGSRIWRTDRTAVYRPALINRVKCTNVGDAHREDTTQQNAALFWQTTPNSWSRPQTVGLHTHTHCARFWQYTRPKSQSNSLSATKHLRKISLI